MRAMRESVSIDLCGGALANGGAQSSSFAVGRESDCDGWVPFAKSVVRSEREETEGGSRVGSDFREGWVAACEGV